MGDHRAQVSKNSVTAKQEVKSSLSNVRRSLSGLPENFLSERNFDSRGKNDETSQAPQFFDYGSIPVFPKSKTSARLNSQALPIQAKLKIGQPNDKYEQEADRVADQVMRMPDPKLQRQPENEAGEATLQPKPLAGQITPLIQRQAEPDEEEELIQPGYDHELEDSNPIMESVPTRDAGELGGEEDELIQTKSLADKPGPVTAELHSKIQSLKGGGQTLSTSERTFFEPRFGTDFSHVRVHNNQQAAQLSQAINARAFTLGQDIVFNAGQYSPASSSGKSLMAHELTHVVQQRTPGNLYGKTQTTEGTVNLQQQKNKQPVNFGLFGYSFLAGISNGLDKDITRLNVKIKDELEILRDHILAYKYINKAAKNNQGVATAIKALKRINYAKKVLKKIKSPHLKRAMKLIDVTNAVTYGIKILESKGFQRFLKYQIKQAAWILAEQDNEIGARDTIGTGKLNSSYAALHMSIIRATVNTYIAELDSKLKKKNKIRAALLKYNNRQAP